MKHQRLFALVLAGALALGLTACGPREPETTATPSPDPTATATPAPSLDPVAREELKVGFLYPGDPSDVGFTRSQSDGADEMAEVLALSEEQIVAVYNVGVDVDCAQALDDLTAAGCQIVFSTSAEFQADVTAAAGAHPEVQFCQMAGDGAAESGLANLHDYYAALYEVRYLSGIAAGLKAKELGNPRLGYVASTPTAQVISGYTAFYLGAKSVWDEVVMDVVYTGSWNDTGLESRTAQALINRGCGVLGQHTDSTGAATMAERMGAFQVGWYMDLRTVAPGAALVSAGAHWGVYFTEAVGALLDGTAIPTDWCKGLADGAVFLTPLNESLVAEGTAEAVETARAALLDGSLQVFAGPLTGVNAGGETLDLAEGEHYAESDVANGGSSAPTFDYVVEGITVVSTEE